MSTSHRIAQGVTGIAIAALGAAGLAATWMPAPATAQSAAADTHEAMHAMMRVMHGSEAVAEMHQAEGVEEMMDQCAGMMDAMGDMSNMMNGRSTRNMMGG